MGLGVYTGDLDCCGCVTVTTAGLLKVSKMPGARSPRSTCQQGCPLSGDSGEPVPCFFQVLVAQAFLGLWLPHPSLTSRITSPPPL